MAGPELVPIRLAPARTMRSASSAVRMPPEALTPTDGPTDARSRATSSTVAPPAGVAGGGLHPCRAGRLGERAGRHLLVPREPARLQDHLHRDAGRRHHPGEVPKHGPVVAGLQRGAPEHHVHLGRPRRLDRGPGLACAGLGAARRPPGSPRSPPPPPPTGQRPGRPARPVRADADRGEPVPARLLAGPENVGLAGVLAEQGVLEERREVARRREWIRGGCAARASPSASGLGVDPGVAAGGLAESPLQVPVEEVARHHAGERREQVALHGRVLGEQLGDAAPSPACA